MILGQGDRFLSTRNRWHANRGAPLTKKSTVSDFVLETMDTSISATLERWNRRYRKRSDGSKVIRHMAQERGYVAFLIGTDIKKIITE